MIYCDHKIDIELYNPNYYELMPYIKKDENHELYLLHNLCRKTGNVIYINNPDNLYKTKLIEFSKIWGIDGLESIKLPTDIKHYDINLTENEYSCLGPYNTPYSTVDFNIDLIFNDVVINNKELRNYFKIDSTKKMHILSYSNYEDALKEIDYINNISNVSSIVFIGNYLLFNERESIINKIKSKNKDIEVFFKMSEEKEIKEENRDNEISDLLESIKKITNLLPSNIKDMTDNVLKCYFDAYLINLKKEQINNNPEIGKKRVFGEIIEMGSARKSLLLKLNNMLFELNNIKGYCEKVSYYEELIKDNNLSNEIFNGIKSIYELFDLNTKKIIIEEIKNIINEEKIVYINLISNSFKNPINKLTLENSMPNDKLLTNLSNYEDKLKNYYKNNKKSFRLLKAMDSEDITIDEINNINYKIRLIELTIQEMYFGNKGILLNKFYEIIDKYKNILLNNISNYSINSNYEDIVILLNEELNNFYENNKDKITTDYKLNKFSNELDNCDRIVKNDKELAICSNNSLIESYMCDIQNLYIKSDKNISIGNLIDSIDKRLYVERCILNSYLSNMDKDYDIDKHYNDLLSFIIDKYYNILDYLNQVDIFKMNYQEDKKYIKTINNYK